MQAPIRFGNVEVRPAEHQLLVAGRQTAIGARAFDLLLALIEHPGRVVPKTELFDRVWPGLVVEENNLQVQISALRKLLGPQAIATVPGRGYRWTQPPQARPAVGEGAKSPLPRTEAPQDSVASSTTIGLPPLFGRSNDVAAVRDLVLRHGLVTVVGPGGVGKTRLAQEVARGLQSQFADGVYWVELATLVESDSVAIALARSVRVAVSDPASTLDVLKQALIGRRVLLVLDNCEHLLQSVGRTVVALRKVVSSLSLLVTSQESLRVDDEHVYRLGTLEVPEPDQIDLALAGENGAIQLFVARAQAASSRFVLGAENVDSVVDICRQLDGLPLAIELAAARVPLLGARGVQQRLNDRFHLLTAGSRFSLRRHQTLLGAIEWSYGLLSEREQSLLDRLGVFVGSFSMESVQQLASDAAQDSWAVLDDLGTLVDKSLVIANGDVVPRYRLLEATRAFALSRLAARGETPTTLRRHAQVMLALFEQGFQDALGGALNDALVARLLPDLDNLRGALRWAGGDNGDLQTAVALIGAAGAGHGFLWNAGLQWEGWQWCEALRQRVDGTVPAVFSARYWLACAELGIAKSIETALEDARRALSQYQSVGDRLGEFLAWDALSYCLLLAGRYDEAFAVLPDLSRVLDPSWPLRLSSIYENQAGLLFLNAGRLDEGRMHLAEYLRLSRLMGSESDELTAVSLLADVEIASGQADRAVELMREALAHIDPELSVGGLEVRNYATALLEAGRLEEAEAAFRNASLRARRALGTVAFVLHDAASLLAQLERIDDAARIAAYAESVYERVGRKPRLVARRNIEKLKTLLATKRSAEALEQLGREGRSLTEEQATLLAFPPR